MSPGLIREMEAKSQRVGIAGGSVCRGVGLVHSPQPVSGCYCSYSEFSLFLHCSDLGFVHSVPLLNSALTLCRTITSATASPELLVRTRWYRPVSSCSCHEAHLATLEVLQGVTGELRGVTPRWEEWHSRGHLIYPHR